MPIQKRSVSSASQMHYKLLIAYCLMSLMPILVGIYIASLFIKYPFEANSSNLTIVSLVTVFSLALSFLGFKITKQLTEPIAGMSQMARNIAQGKLDGAIADIKGVDELEELSDSLKTISKNARELLEKVEKLSVKDNLTGLYNASYLRERLNEEIQRAIHYQQPCSLAYFCVNSFEECRAQFGQEWAEQLLKGVAGALSGQLSPLDRAARVGTSEFAVIFPDKNKKKTIEAVEKIQKTLMQGNLAAQGDGAVSFGVSVGVSENPMDGISADELIRKARERMKAAKSKGSQTIEAFL